MSNVISRLSLQPLSYSCHHLPLKGTVHIQSLSTHLHVDGKLGEVCGSKKHFTAKEHSSILLNN